MNTPYTEEDVDNLYRLIGKSVWHLQHLENVVASFTALSLLQKERKKGTKITKEIAARTLEKQRSQTLGPLITSAKKQKAIPDYLVDRFDSFLKERNWLIHKCVVNEYLSLRAEGTKIKVFLRIESFAEEAVALQNEIFGLLQKWYIGEGYDLNEAESIATASLKAAEKS